MRRDAARAPHGGVGERGGAFGCLLWLVLLVALGYVAIQFGTPYVQYWRFKDAMQGQAAAAELNSDAEIRQYLLEEAERLALPLDARELQIRRRGDTIKITAEWSREVVLPKFRRTLHFQPQATAPLTSEPQ